MGQAWDLEVSKVHEVQVEAYNVGQLEKIGVQVNKEVVAGRRPEGLIVGLVLRCHAMIQRRILAMGISWIGCVSVE